MHVACGHVFAEFDPFIVATPGLTILREALCRVNVKGWKFKARYKHVIGFRAPALGLREANSGRS